MSLPRYVTAHPDQRNCALYRIYVLDPRTNYTTICLGYIGETARLAFVRFMEHLYEQPFGDTIVGAPQVDPRLFVGKGAVLAAEKAAIEAERPLYNYEHNLSNPDRVPIPVARRQREARDRARGVPSPVWSAPSAGGTVAAQRVVSRLPWTARRRWAVALGVLWAVLVSAGYLGASHFGAAGRVALWDGVGGASALLLAGWLCWPVKGVRRARRRRKAAVALLAATVLLVGWSLTPAGQRQVPSPPSAVVPR